MRGWILLLGIEALEALVPSTSVEARVFLSQAVARTRWQLFVEVTSRLLARELLLGIENLDVRAR